MSGKIGTLSTIPDGNVWLCPVKPRSWRVIENAKVIGFPRHVKKVFERARVGDIIVIHVFKPVNGIIAMAEVASGLFEGNRDLWGKGRYPLRVKIRILKDLVKAGRKPIPLGALFGKASDPEVTVEPYLRSVWITRITKAQYLNLQKHFQRNAS